MKIVIANLLDSNSSTLAKAISASCLPHAEDPPLVLQEHTQINPAIPHISHLHLDIDPMKIELLHTALWQMIACYPQGKVTGIFQTVEVRRQWLLWKIEASPDLQELHRRIIDVAVPYRQAPMDTQWPITAEQKEMLEEYGYPYCGSCFEPHVTLSRLRHPSHLPELVQTYRNSPFIWRSQTLVIGMLGQHGTMTRVIARLPLIAEMHMD